MRGREVHLVADPYPPYQFEEKGRIRGIDWEVIALAFHKMDYRAQARLLSWEGCMEQMESGEADGIFQIARTPEREKSFLFSDLLRSAGTVFLAGSQWEIRLEDHVPLQQQLNPFKLGLLAGYSYDPSIDNLPPGIKVAVDDQAALLRGLTEGRYDLVLMDLGVAQYLIAREGFKGIKWVEGYRIPRDLHVAFQLNRRDLLAAFNQGLGAVREQGEELRILSHYGLNRAMRDSIMRDNSEGQ